MGEGKKGKIYRVNLNDENGTHIYYEGSRARVEQTSEELNKSRYGGPLEKVRVTYEEVPEQDITREIRENAEYNGKGLYRLKRLRNDFKSASSAIKEIDPNNTSDIKYGKVREWLTKKRMQRRQQKLNARNLEGALSVITLVAGFLFLSPGITGKAIAGIAVKSSSFLGAGLVIVGLIAGLFWVRNR